MPYKYMFTVPTEFGPAVHASDKTPNEIKEAHPKARITERITLSDDGKVQNREPYTNAMNPVQPKVEQTTTTTTTPAPKKGK